MTRLKGTKEEEKYLKKAKAILIQHADELSEERAMYYFSKHKIPIILSVYNAAARLPEGKEVLVLPGQGLIVDKGAMLEDQIISRHFMNNN